MKKVIWKFQLEVRVSQILDLPIGSEILCVQTQHGKPCLWVLVNPEVQNQKRMFETFGTGYPISYNAEVERKYIGSYQLEGGNFVGHLFERL